MYAAATSYPKTPNLRCTINNMEFAKVCAALQYAGATGFKDTRVLRAWELEKDVLYDALLLCVVGNDGDNDNDNDDANATSTQSQSRSRLLQSPSVPVLPPPLPHSWPHWTTLSRDEQEFAAAAFADLLSRSGSRSGSVRGSRVQAQQAEVDDARRQGQRQGHRHEEPDALVGQGQPTNDDDAHEHEHKVAVGVDDDARATSSLTPWWHAFFFSP